MKLKKQNIIKLFMILGILTFSYSYSIAQETTEEEELENFEESYEENEPRFFDDINETRFKSNFSEIDESRKIDYSRTGGGRERNELNIFGDANDFSQYQFKDDNLSNQQSNPTNRIIFSSESGSWQRAPSVDQTPNANAPTVSNPFGTNPGVKTPRNMDAVPDNGDDPNDVPLDGGVLVLGLAAISYGYKRVISKQ
jgi:hypothetical protein